MVLVARPGARAGTGVLSTSPSTPPVPSVLLALVAWPTVEVVLPATIAFGTDLVPLVAGTAGNVLTMTVNLARSETFSTPLAKLDGRDVVAVGIIPLRRRLLPLTVRVVEGIVVLVVPPLLAILATLVVLPRLSPLITLLS